MNIPRVTSREIVAENHWTRIIVDSLEFDGGENGNYIIVEKEIGLAIIPLFHKNDKLYTVMVKQYRHPIKKEVLQFPMGSLEKNQNPEDHAREELRQETGLEMQKLTLVAEYFVDPGLSRQKCMVFIAEGLLKEGESAPEDTEINLHAIYIPVSDLNDMINKQEICDSWGIAQTHILQHYLKQNGLK